MPSFLVWPANGQRVLGQSRLVILKLCCVHVAPCHLSSSPAGSHSASLVPLWSHPASVLEEGTRHHRQTQLRPEKPRGPQRQKGRSIWSWIQPPQTGTEEWCSGAHPGALSSCCVCASFFCAPHRCYENLHSPAGNVTSARAAFSQAPALGPAVGGGLIPTDLAASMTSGLSSSLPSSFQTPLPLVLAHCSEFSLHCTPLSLLPERYLGNSSNSGECSGASCSAPDEFISC